MKKILFFYFVIVSSYSQTPLHDLLKSCKGVSEINTSKSNITKIFLDKDDIINGFNSNKIIKLYKDSNAKPEIYITPINSSIEFNVYVEIPLVIFEEEKKSTIFNVFGSYLIFNKKTNTLYRIDSQTVCGSVYHKKKNTLVIYRSFNELLPTVFILDKNLNRVKIPSPDNLN